VGQRVVAALGWEGIAHIDMREDPESGEVRVIEVNPRYWSSLLASHAAGVNFPYLACLSALGVLYAPPQVRLQRFAQARSALMMVARALIPGADLRVPGIRETIWAYLLRDPLPHAFGRVGSMDASETPVIPGERRAAKAA